MNEPVKHFDRVLIALFTAMALSMFTYFSLVGNAASTAVPGHQRSSLDKDNNGYPDAGVSVNGHYTSLYAYDESGNWFWDLGDGRISGTVASLDALDPETLTRCDYVINYRGKFENDPFLNSGWVQNLVNCSGYDDEGQYNYMIVSESDPRYTGNPEWAIWGNWEYHNLVESGSGNLVRPRSHVNL